MSTPETREPGSLADRLDALVTPLVAFGVGVCLSLAVGCGRDGGQVEAAEKGDDPSAALSARAASPDGGAHTGAEPSAPEEADVPGIAALEIPDPDDPVVLLEPSEILTVSVQDWLHALAQKIAIRDLRGVAQWFAPDFLGRDAFGTPPAERHDLPLGAVAEVYEPQEFEIVGAPAFLAGLEGRVSSWRRVLQSEWKVTAAEFQDDEPVRWGKLELHVLLTGVSSSGGRFRLDGHFTALIENLEAGWQLARLEVDALESSRKRDPLFVDVSRATGIAHEGIRYGQPGNDSDAWNGVAAGDVDGDGRIDVFVPSSKRNFLYLNRGDGGFAEVATERGVLGEGGGTGALFLDFDNDGDQDLVVAHVGAPGTGRELVGDTTHLYENDGRGYFVDATAGSGLDRPAVAYSMTAFDYDGDGFLDLFLCGYGRMDVERNNSWLEATNGSPNRLLRNVDGERFEDVTARAGLDDWRWSYQAAAADYDRDGDIDLYVANNFGSNRLWRNEGDGTFTDVSTKLGVAQRGNSMAVCWGDLNSDGWLDLFVAGPTSVAGKRVVGRLRGAGRDTARDDVLEGILGLASGNALFFSDGEGGFERAPAGYGAAGAGWVWSTALADFDLDGALDVFCVNGFVTGDLPQDT